MRDGEETVFVEVKLRSNEGYGTPAEAVDRKKRERYRKMALYRFGGREEAFRFDVVEVCGKKISHIRDAF